MIKRKMAAPLLLFFDLERGLFQMMSENKEAIPVFLAGIAVFYVRVFV
jgi:hypothetical protein